MLVNSSEYYIEKGSSLFIDRKMLHRIRIRNHNDIDIRPSPPRPSHSSSPLYLFSYGYSTDACFDDDTVSFEKNK